MVSPTVFEVNCFTLLRNARKALVQNNCDVLQTSDGLAAVQLSEPNV